MLTEKYYNFFCIIKIPIHGIYSKGLGFVLFLFFFLEKIFLESPLFLFSFLKIFPESPLFLFLLHYNLLNMRLFSVGNAENIDSLVLALG